MSYNSDAGVTSSSYYGEDDDSSVHLSPDLSDTQTEANISSIMSGVDDLNIADEPRTLQYINQSYSERRVGSDVEYLRSNGFASQPRHSVRARYEPIADHIRTPEDIHNFIREMSTGMDASSEPAKDDNGPEQTATSTERKSAISARVPDEIAVPVIGVPPLATEAVSTSPASMFRQDYLSQPQLPEKYYHTNVGIEGCLSHMHRCNFKPFEHSNTDYNLLVTGQPGSGKSTFKSMLVNVSLDDHSACKNHKSDYTNASDSLELILCDRLAVPYLTKVSEVFVKKHQTITVSVVDSCHHGGNIDARAQWHRHSDYLKEELELYHLRESQPDRRAISDCRIHACVYFLSPDTAQLSVHDIQHMKELSEVTSLILVVGKADSLTTKEKEMRRDIIKMQLYEHNIKCYQPQGAQEVVNYPLFVIAATEQSHDECGRPALGRRVGAYFINSFDDQICENNTLRRVLFDDHMLDIVRQTSDKYELARHNFQNLINCLPLLSHSGSPFCKELSSSSKIEGAQTYENEDSSTYQNHRAKWPKSKTNLLVPSDTENNELNAIIEAHLDAGFRLKMKPLNLRLDMLDDLSKKLRDERTVLLEEIAQLQIEVAMLEQQIEPFKTRKRFAFGS